MSLNKPKPKKNKGIRAWAVIRSKDDSFDYPEIHSAFVLSFTLLMIFTDESEAKRFKNSWDKKYEVVPVSINLLNK